MKWNLRVAALAAIVGLGGGLVGCGGGQPPAPPPAPQPVVPPPAPVPPAPPTIAGFVVIHDPDQPGQAMGQLLSSPKVQGLLRATDFRHAFVSKNALDETGKTPADVKRYIDAAAGKAYPYLFIISTAGDTVKELTCPQKPDDFCKLFDTHTGKRRLGNIAPPDGLRVRWKMFGETANTKRIPRSEWVETDLSYYLPAVKDQDGVGACNAFATVEATEGSREIAGLPYRKLSPGYLYGNIASKDAWGRPLDQGSMLEDGLAWMTQHGTCTAATVGELDWNHAQWPSAAAAEAKSFVVTEALLCPTFDDLASAIQQGFFVVEGVEWWDGYHVGDDGWLIPQRSGGSGGHALCGCGLKKKADGSWGILTRNSWGPTWGVGGNAVFPESLFKSSVGGFWAVRSVVRNQATAAPSGLELKVTPKEWRDRKVSDIKIAH